MSFSLPKALILGVCSLFVLMGLSQALTLWWFQQQLQQELSEQSQALSRIILARTAEKLQHQFVFNTNSAVQVFTTDQGAQPQVSVQSEQPAAATAPAQNTPPDRQVEVRKLENGITIVKMQQHDDGKAKVDLDLNLQLEQTLAELKQQGAAPQHWVSQFKLKTSGSSQQLINQYLGYQLLALALSTALALLLLLWFGARLLQPLQRLVQGFRALAQGEAGIQLDTQAPLAEYRQALKQFNLASTELAALQQQKAELARQQQLVELGEMSRGLVHALRNPIHTMALALEQVSGNDPALQQLIEQKMQHINRTLSTLLTLSCQGVDRSTPVALKAVLQDLCLEFSAQQLQLDAPTLSCRGAEAELRFILHVLVSNAVEASPQPGTVYLKLWQATDGIYFQVTDQGPGLSPTVAASLFQPHISSKAEGAGMGLYLAQRLLQMYYLGDIELQNRPGGGVLAQIRLGTEINQ
ncbi:sensor histidine kinase [Rheinheimera texasensis]|uniref:sensor histidine kinase n=1 Tax=Rheinheimera texasensis TaxID=306205 RepID=UPI0004E195F6|nr:HAMP domain-containing sensor histidine kinase [Rheinheimera texasensis]